MAEFCFECWEKINQKKFSKNEYRLSRDLEKCEGCGEWKRVIECTRFQNCHPRVRELILFWESLGEILSCLSRKTKKKRKNDKVK